MAIKPTLAVKFATNVKFDLAVLKVQKLLV